ncbi:DUF6207 family protein [Streptomyces sp. NPDC056462]|uniref:DUF6207 family protein n=1 Tax=Streptomyces sp. NPDC056462 TaxID=3345826 RepID=UPI0036D0AC26
MAEVMRLLSAGRRVTLTRGKQQLAALALAARDLKDGRRTLHPELIPPTDRTTRDPGEPGVRLRCFLDLRQELDAAHEAERSQNPVAG